MSICSASGEGCKSRPIRRQCVVNVPLYAVQPYYQCAGRRHNESQCSGKTFVETQTVRSRNVARVVTTYDYQYISDSRMSKMLEQSSSRIRGLAKIRACHYLTSASPRLLSLQLAAYARQDESRLFGRFARPVPCELRCRHCLGLG